MRYLRHVMRQAESSRDTVQRRKNSCLRDAFVFFSWHTARHQPIAVISGQCRSRADNLQSGTVEAGRVTPCASRTWHRRRHVATFYVNISHYNHQQQHQITQL